MFLFRLIRVTSNTWTQNGFQNASDEPLTQYVFARAKVIAETKENKF